MPRRLTLIVLMLLVVAACGGDDDTGANGGDGDDTGASDPVETVIEVNALSYPAEAAVAAGAAVRWLNSSGVPHTVEFDTHDGAETSEASLDLPADGETSATLDPGVWAYHCAIHPSMVGTLTVAG